MPKIGLISDSHAQAARTTAAAKRLLNQGADLLIHLGDINSLSVLDALALNHPKTNRQVIVHIVFGNTDYDADEYTRYAQSIGLTVDHPVGKLTLGDKTLVFTHGHLRHAMLQAIAEKANYLCHGHTHKRADHIIEQTRVINPGALTRVHPYTVALLDTDTDHLEFMTIDANN